MIGYVHIYELEIIYTSIKVYVNVMVMYNQGYPLLNFNLASILL
jgi:hypothetical protein